MVGGVVAIVWGLVLAGMSWGSMWPWGAFVSWVAPQQLLTQWVVGSLLVGGVLLVGGARAAGAALVGSSFCSSLAYLPLKGLYGGDHLETLVHGAVILASVGLVVFGLAGLRGAAGEVRRRRALAEDFRVPRVLLGAPLGRYPMALPLAFDTIVVGALLILRIQAEAAPTCSLFDGPNVRVTNTSSPFAASCFRGFEDPWLQALLAFNVAFLALLFLVQAWQASRSSGEEEAGDPISAVWGRVMEGLARSGGPPFL